MDALICRYSISQFTQLAYELCSFLNNEGDLVQITETIVLGAFIAVYFQQCLKVSAKNKLNHAAMTNICTLYIVGDAHSFNF